MLDNSSLPSVYKINKTYRTLHQGAAKPLGAVIIIRLDEIQLDSCHTKHGNTAFKEV